MYDALTSRRVYKEAFNHDVAKSIIVQDAGSHFDPVVVQAFEAVAEMFIETRERFAEDNASAA